MRSNLLQIKEMHRTEMRIKGDPDNNYHCDENDDKIIYKTSPGDISWLTVFSALACYGMQYSRAFRLRHQVFTTVAD